jgi:hydroxymethylbilane synthase
LAVHSLKDLTSHMPPELCLAGVPEREDPRDAWVSPQGLRLSEVPPGARVGTSSLRRRCQLLFARPDLEVVPLRGNVQRRLDKTRELGLAGTVLALAGLRRLGVEAQVTEALSVDVSLPAVGQGALALQCRTDDGQTRARLEALNHSATWTAVEAERGFLERLEGGCAVPLAGHATVMGSEVRLAGLIGDPDGKRVLRAQRSGEATQARAVGRVLAEELLSKGGAEILAAFAGRTAG